MDLVTWKAGAVQLTPPDASALLVQLGQKISEAQAKVLRYRLLRGRVLIEIRERELWREMKISPEGVPEIRFRTWTDFIDRGFPILSGLAGDNNGNGHKDRTAHDDIALAESKILNQLPEPEISKIKSIGNAKHVRRLERGGVAITPEVISAAQTMETHDFRRVTGCDDGAWVKLWLASVEAAEELQRLVEVLAGQGRHRGTPATPDAIRNLVELLISDELNAYAPGNDDKIDAILGAVRAELSAAHPPEEPMPTDTNEVETIEPGSAVREAERITGLRVETVFSRRNGDHHWAVYGYRYDEPRPWIYARSDVSEKDAVDELLAKHLKKTFQAICQEQGWKCASCGKVLPLQDHHIKFRSKERDDRRENREAVCAGCHHKKHGKKYAPLTDDPVVLECC